MANDRLISAVDRLEQAIARAEAAIAARPVDELRDLRARHALLRGQAGEALERLNQLIEATAPDAASGGTG